MSSDQTSNAATAEKPLRELPAALRGRGKVIYSENPAVDGVVVSRWTIGKSLLIIPEIFAIWRDLPDAARRKIAMLGGEPETEEAKIEQQMAIADVASISIEHCLGRVVYIVRLSVEEEDKDKIDLMDADEILDLVSGILEVNPDLIPKLKKKAPNLLERFAPLFVGSKKTTP